MSTITLWIGLCCWYKKSDDIENLVDAHSTTPKDFSIEVHGLPKETQDGQLLAFFDNIVANKLMNFKVNLTDKSEVEKMNDIYSLSKQKKALLENEKSTADLKLGITVKKLDNSIYDFLDLTYRADAIRAYRTKLYLSNKTDYYGEGIDSKAEKMASLEGGDYKLNKMYDE